MRVPHYRETITTKVLQHPVVHRNNEADRLWILTSMKSIWWYDNTKILSISNQYAINSMFVAIRCFMLFLQWIIWPEFRVKSNTILMWQTSLLTMNRFCLPKNYSDVKFKLECKTNDVQRMCTVLKCGFFFFYIEYHISKKHTDNNVANIT